MKKSMEIENIYSMIKEPEKKQLLWGYLTFNPIIRGVSIFFLVLISAIIIYVWILSPDQLQNQISNTSSQAHDQILTIVGIFATAFITLSLLMIKEGIDEKNLEKHLFARFVRELGLNIALLRHNILGLETYLKTCEKTEGNIGQIYLTPIYKLNFEIWDLIKQNFSHIEFIKDSGNLESVIINTRISNESIDHLNRLSTLPVKLKDYLKFHKGLSEELINTFKDNIEVFKDYLESIGVLVIFDMNTVDNLEIYLKNKDHNPNFETKQKEIINNDLKSKSQIILYKDH